MAIRAFITLLVAGICFGQISRNPQFVQFLQYDTSYTATGQEPIGTRYWDEAEGTTSLVLDNGVVLQDGQEVYYPVINQSGNNLDNGKVAYYAGTNGNSGRLKISYSVASSTSVIPYFLGVITEPILNGNTGKVTRFGKVRGIQTNGANYSETWSDGDVLYVSTTNQGGMTNVRPTAPNPAIKIGWVISAHNTNGTIFVSPSYPDRLEDLSDVNGKPLVNTGQIPVWDNTSDFFDFTHRIESALAKTDTSLVTGKGIADYTQTVKDSIYTKIDPTFTAGSLTTTLRIGNDSQTFGSVLRMSGGTSSGAAIAYRNYLNIVDSSNATGRVAIFGGTGETVGGGLWLWGKDHNIGSDTTKRGIVEIFTNSQNGVATLGGALRWLMYDGSAFRLRYAGLRDGSHNWYQQTGTLVGGFKSTGLFNSVAGFELNGTNINTSGTLSNVAYNNKANTFTSSQTIASNLVFDTKTSIRSILGNTNDTDGHTGELRLTSADGVGVAKAPYIVLYGGTHATYPNQIRFVGGTINSVPATYNFTGNITASGTITGTNHIAGSANFFYFGAEGTDGSWRIGRSGDNLVFERRESGSWVTKQTMTP